MASPPPAPRFVKTDHRTSSRQKRRRRSAAPRVSVDELRTRARNQRQTGDRVQALNTAVEGLKLFPKDAGLTAILNSLLADGQAAVTRAKREATNVNAQERAEEMFAAGVQKEREADKLRRSGRTDDATRALWIAADQFRTAADHARQVADEEAAEQARIEARPKAGGVTNAPPRNTPAPAGDAKPPDGAVEEALVAKALRQYEAGYAKLNADAVRSVYPSAPVEELRREFAGYRSYTLTVKVHNYDFLHQGDLFWMNVPATVVHVISPKAGATTTFQRDAYVPDGEAERDLDHSSDPVMRWGSGARMNMLKRRPRDQVHELVRLFSDEKPPSLPTSGPAHARTPSR